jgi:hypothetical protein
MSQQNWKTKHKKETRKYLTAQSPKKEACCFPKLTFAQVLKEKKKVRANHMF